MENWSSLETLLTATVAGPTGIKDRNLVRLNFPLRRTQRLYSDVFWNSPERFRIKHGLGTPNRGAIQSVLLIIKGNSDHEFRNQANNANCQQVLKSNA